jgi:hypothetical protein
MVRACELASFESLSGMPIKNVRCQCENKLSNECLIDHAHFRFLNIFLPL